KSISWHPLAISETHQQSTNDIYQVKLGESPNPYAPFSLEIDWGVARWAKLQGPSSTVFSELLKIPGIVEKLGLSYSNAQELNNIIDKKLPGCPPF
ncbi:hypothetical protein L208DRAFT_1225163, partial [Tricholoma matsutake]